MNTVVSEQIPSASAVDERLTVRAAPLELAARWDEFVAGHPDGTFFHRFGWRHVIERSCGHRTHYLYVEDDGEIEAILPLAHVKSVLFGNALISTPFCVYGGAIARTQAARDAIELHACRLAEQLGVDYLELRNRTPSGTALLTKDLYVTFRKPISADADVNMRHRVASLGDKGPLDPH